MKRRRIALIAGGGKHGSIALRYFSERRPAWQTLVCDEDAHCEASALIRQAVELSRLGTALEAKRPALVVGDAVELAFHLFSRRIAPDFVVPCVPVHFAAKVVVRFLANKGLSVEPFFEPLNAAFNKAELVGFEYRLSRENALVVASKMPFNMLCQSGCAQPQRCPVTGNRLLKPMYKLVADVLDGHADFVKVLRSRLIGANVGGYPGEELKKVIDMGVKRSPCIIAVATSCNCHAVANIFRVRD